MIKRNLLLIGLTALLSACGFQLRGTGDVQFTLTELNVTARNAYGETVKQVTETLENNKVKVNAGAPYTLALVNEQETQRSASYTSSAQTAENELTTRLDYEIRGGSKNLLLLNNQLEVRSIQTRDGNNIVGSDEEMAQLRQEMRRDLINQLMLRLQLITPAQLDALLQTAEAKAQAEADAEEAARQRQAAEPQQSPMEIPAQ
ncbi:MULTISPECIES: LPS-assembly lipoprotein LptE [Pseudomonas]|uniref:LPS-assembly lipoprotein LptE n=1 Tax=Pseudomonas segetis TaxID=298908 RepID=A0A239H1S8_9PSED|nr:MULTISPECIES: LPS assembly lipoprotein LptE [Pseudomonas]SNS75369.1 LPS-assembly lipoprotein [Pseudomonas segetis]